MSSYILFYTQNSYHYNIYLGIATTLLHASLLSINPDDALKLNAAKELKACHVKMPMMVS